MRAQGSWVVGASLENQKQLAKPQCLNDRVRRGPRPVPILAEINKPVLSFVAVYCHLKQRRCFKGFKITIIT